MEKLQTIPMQAVQSYVCNESFVGMFDEEDHVCMQSQAAQPCRVSIPLDWGVELILIYAICYPGICRHTHYQKRTTLWYLSLHDIM